MGGNCPFGKGCEIDSPSCRKCQWFYRTGTGTFFWCNHPIEHKPVEIEHKTPKITQPKRKRGRPKKNAIFSSFKSREMKKQ